MKWLLWIFWPCYTEAYWKWDGIYLCDVLAQSVISHGSSEFKSQLDWHALPSDMAFNMTHLSNGHLALGCEKYIQCGGCLWIGSSTVCSPRNWVSRNLFCYLNVNEDLDHMFFAWLWHCKEQLISSLYIWQIWIWNLIFLEKVERFFQGYVRRYTIRFEIKAALRMITLKTTAHATLQLNPN